MTFKFDRLPKSIRIGAYDVHFEFLEGDNARKNLGEFNRDDQCIRLRREYKSGAQAVDTVLHEILHAVLAYGSAEIKYGEEHLVSILGSGLTQIVRDNAELTKWILATVGK